MATVIKAGTDINTAEAIRKATEVMVTSMLINAATDTDINEVTTNHITDPIIDLIDHITDLTTGHTMDRPIMHHILFTLIYRSRSI